MTVELDIDCDCYGDVTFLLCAHIVIGIEDYGDARELKGHVEACEVTGMIVGESDVTKACGDGWYCDRAPIKERS